MNETPDSNTATAGPNGSEKRMWFVAIVNNNTEKAAEERLVKLGYECYVAKQTVVRIWKNGRKGKVDKVLLPSVVFIKCTEKERREVVALPFINRFMTNKAAKTTGLTKPIAVIPQRQIDILKFMLGQTDIPVTITDAPYKVHDKIVVIRGGLKGLEGEVVRCADNKSELIVRIDILGCASITIDSVDIEHAK